MAVPSSSGGSRPRVNAWVELGTMLSNGAGVLGRGLYRSHVEIVTAVGGQHGGGGSITQCHGPSGRQYKVTHTREDYLRVTVNGYVLALAEEGEDDTSLSTGASMFPLGSTITVTTYLNYMTWICSASGHTFLSV